VPRQQMETKMTDNFSMEIEIRGFLFEIDVYVEVTEGGSNSYGSDEPAWFDLEIEDIRGSRCNKPVSPALFDKIVKHYENNIVDRYR
jgi:hypothetical protein